MTDPPPALNFGGPEGKLLSRGVALKLAGQAGREVVTRVRVTNSGDVPLTLDDAVSVRLRRAGALGRAVREGFVPESGDVLSRLVALGKRLDEEPCTELSVRYGAAFAALAPGETGEVEIRVRVPAGVSSDQEWTGQIPVLGSRVPASLELASKGSSRRPPRSNGRKGRRVRGDDE